MAKTNKPFNVKSYTIAVLRRGSYRLRSRTDALKAAKLGRNMYRCQLCKKIFGRKEIQVDHLVPIVPITGWDNWDGFINRLYCEADGLQVLCKTPCHKEKTQAENRLRKFHRDAKKEKQNE